MTDKIPHVYIACLACYNAGRLVGRAMDLDETFDVEMIEPEAIHGGADNMTRYVLRDGGSPHEEYVVHDSEYVPIRGEFSAGSVPEIADLYADLVRERSADEWEAYCAFSLEIVGTYLPAVEDFVDAYMGTAPSFREWVLSADGPDPFDDIPSERPPHGDGPWLPEGHPVRTYFDWYQYAEDEESNYNTASVDDGVAIFSA